MNSHEKDMSPLHIWLHVQSALLGVIFILTLVLNTLLILVLRKMKSRRSNRDCASYNIERSYMFLVFHLAFADMLGVILNIPFDIFRNAGITYYFSTAGCAFLPPFQLASTTAQAGTYVALSYHRFRAIVHPIRAKLTVCKSVIMATIIWVVSICLSMPYVIANKFNETDRECYEKWDADPATIYTFAIFVVQYAAPVILMGVFYIAIARTLHEHRVAKELVHVPTQDDVRSHKHIVKMLVTIVTVYGVCMLPHHIFWIVIGFMQNVDPTVYKIVSSISYLFTYSNSIANPIVFFFYNKESRYHLKRIFRKIFCARALDVPFEIKKWSATWSAASKSESERPRDTKRISKDHLKLEKLFPPRHGDSELGVSLPWEAQVMTSHCSSESYRDYPSSPPIPEHPTSESDPFEYTSDATNPFMYAGEARGTQVYLSEPRAHEKSSVDENALIEDFSRGCEGDDFCEETGGYRNKDEILVGSTGEAEISENEHEGVFEGGDEGACDEVPWNEEDTETASEAYGDESDDTARVQRMIERMMQDIRHELKEDVGMNGMRKLEDILNLTESSSNGDDWEAIMNSGEGLNGSLVHLDTSAQDLVKIMTGSRRDVHGFRERLEHLPETRM